MDKLVLDTNNNPVQDEKGNYLFTDGKGKDFYKAEKKEKIAEIQVQAKRYRENENLKLEEQEKQEKQNMAEENITKFDVLKEKVDNLKAETKEKILEREKTEKDLDNRLRALDAKVCHGEECQRNVEASQQNTMTALLERLKKLEEPLFLCSNCGVGTMRRGDTQCSYCGVKVKSWN